jgi:hypothetical protein
MTDNDLGPLEKERAGTHHSAEPDLKKSADSTATTNQLHDMALRQPERSDSITGQMMHRRRAASWRLPVLDSGRSDPWHYDDPGVLGYEAAAAHLLGHGLLPSPNQEGLLAMWRRGGHCRQAAELIAEAWGLVA